MRASLRHPEFARFAAARFLATLAWHMMSTAVGWQVYALTRDPLALGFVGLAQFLPFIALILPGGEAADRADRRTMLVVAYSAEAMAAAILLWFALVGHVYGVWIVFAAVALCGGGRAFWMPAGQAMTPTLVPSEVFPEAIAVNSTLFQVATIAGPSIGGLVYLAGPAAVYGTVLALVCVVIVLMLSIRPRAAAAAHSAFHKGELLDGLRFVFRKKTVLGALTLDLFAVLFGGATALLPIYASDVLQVGPLGLGFLRTAPGVGAAFTAAALALRPIKRPVGAWLFGGVTAFAIGTVVFGLSTSFVLSLVALVTIGAGDMVSVYVRHLLVQLETPNAIRGRVSAVSSMFIGASNELGEFESGITAKWLGLVPAVVAGGAATLAVVGACFGIFPELRRMDRFPDPARPEDEPQA